MATLASTKAAALHLTSLPALATGPGVPKTRLVGGTPTDKPFLFAFLKSINPFHFFFEKMTRHFILLFNRLDGPRACGSSGSGTTSASTTTPRSWRPARFAMEVAISMFDVGAKKLRPMCERCKQNPLPPSHTLLAVNNRRPRLGERLEEELVFFGDA